MGSRWHQRGQSFRDGRSRVAIMCQYCFPLCQRKEGPNLLTISIGPGSFWYSCATIGGLQLRGNVCAEIELRVTGAASWQPVWTSCTLSLQGGLEHPVDVLSYKRRYALVSWFPQIIVVYKAPGCNSTCTNNFPPLCVRKFPDSYSLWFRFID